MRPIEPGDRQARRRSPPFDRIETRGEILPRPEGCLLFPEPELTLTRPAHAPEKPERTEVMEEREEQWTRAGGPEDRRAGN